MPAGMKRLARLCQATLRRARHLSSITACACRRATASNGSAVLAPVIESRSRSESDQGFCYSIELLVKLIGWAGGSERFGAMFERPARA